MSFFIRSLLVFYFLFLTCHTAVAQETGILAKKYIIENKVKMVFFLQKHSSDTAKSYEYRPDGTLKQSTIKEGELQVEFFFDHFGRLEKKEATLASSSGTKYGDLYYHLQVGQEVPSENDIHFGYYDDETGQSVKVLSFHFNSYSAENLLLRIYSYSNNRLDNTESKYYYDDMKRLDSIRTEMINIGGDNIFGELITYDYDTPTKTKERRSSNVIELNELQITDYDELGRVTEIISYPDASDTTKYIKTVYSGNSQNQEFSSKTFVNGVLICSDLELRENNLIRSMTISDVSYALEYELWPGNK
ncbi:MAG: hypothetical protein ACI956_002512 [Nonlabens sp.]|jgi:hypothetical protein